MLQKSGPVYLLWIWIPLVSVTVSLGCKSETATPSAEEIAYLADYETSANKWGYIDKTGKLVIEAVFDDVGQFSEGLAAINQNGKWGYIDRKGKMVIPIIYKSGWAFHENRARVKPFDQPDSYIYPSGTSLASAQWSAAGDFSEGLALVKVGNLFGYIDSTGSMAIQPIYARGQNFRHGLAVIEIEERSGVINKAGELLVPARFDKIILPEEAGIILCMQANTAEAFDFSGRQLVKLENANMTASDGHLIVFNRNDKYYFYDLDHAGSKPTMPYDHIIPLGQHRWAGRKGEEYSLLDNEGEKIDTILYQQINHFKEGVAAYRKNKTWGYLNLNGEVLSSNIFRMAWDFNEGVARVAGESGITKAVGNNGLLFINKEWKVPIYPPSGTLDVRDFSEGLSPVQLIH